MIVADSNLIAYYVWPGSRSAVTDAVWTRDPQWIAPKLWESELRNALSIAVRRALVSVDEAVAAVDVASGIVRGQELLPSSRAVLELAHASGCTAYDCEYVALAVALRVPLVTSDRAVLRAFPTVAVSPAEFGAHNP